MKHKPPKKSKPLLPDIIKELMLPKVKPIAPVVAKHGDRALIKALPYYLIRFSDEIYLFAKLINNKPLKLALYSVSTILNLLGKYYKIKE